MLWAPVPSVGLLAAGALRSVAVVDNPFAGPPDDAAAADIIARLTGNLHTALGERDVGERHDALAVSIAEPQLPTILPELQRALIINIQGGGLARIDAVKDIAVKDIREFGSNGGFRTSAEWSVDARAGHWGHLHQRSVRFSALMDLQPIDNAWKLTGLTVLNVSQ